MPRCCRLMDETGYVVPAEFDKIEKLKVLPPPFPRWYEPLDF